MPNKYKFIPIKFAVIAIVLASCSKSSSSNCTATKFESGDNCGCVIGLPVDTAKLVPIQNQTIWPFGVHGTDGHKEGHPGIDFISSEITDVFAVADGEISKIEEGNSTEYVSGSKSVYVEADCGITYDYQPVVLDSSLKVGSRVSKGQKIGTTSEMVPPYGPGRFSFHFDTRETEQDPDVKWESFCPGLFMSETDVATLQGMVDSSTYNEKFARTPTITCSDGSSKTFNFAAQTKICNPHLDQSTASQLESCLNYGSGRPVW
jgi:hypothetical protein